MHARLAESTAFPGLIYAEAPRNVYWEMTTACDLVCKHCRACAQPLRDPLELTTEDGRRLMRDVKEMGSLLILTGGDPMKREDLFELLAYARELHLPVGITPSTTPTLTREAVLRFQELGVLVMGMSIDGPDARRHDGFRGVPGTFDRAQEALGWAREAGLAVQVNTTVTTETMAGLTELYEVLRTKAPPVKRWSLFLLVPVGRGTDLGIPSPSEVENLFRWIYDISQGAPFHLSTVEAPHYRRYWIERRLAEGATQSELRRVAPKMGFGLRDGNGVIFVSHRGDVFPAGFLPHPRLGNVRETPLSAIYRFSPALAELRDMDKLRGKCRRCELRWACGGSRARAYSMEGDPMGSDPFCAYEPA